MRAAAEQIVAPNRRDLVEQVFGTARQPSPWHWSSASFVDPRIRRRARTAIEEGTRTVAERTLRFAEEVWARDATFNIEPLALADDPVLHTLTLKASAQAVQSLGMDRRRGLGWVTIRPDPPLTDEDLDTLIRMVMTDA